MNTVERLAILGFIQTALPDVREAFDRGREAIAIAFKMFGDSEAARLGLCLALAFEAAERAEAAQKENGNAKS